MKHIFSAIKNRHVRASAQSGLSRAATLPTSGFTAVDNSQGASRATAEFDRAEAEVIGLAWDCAAKAYEPDTADQPDRPERTGLKLDFSLPSSAAGSIKATTCSTFTPQQQPGSGTVCNSYLVIAVRGSASKVDHIVNLHGEPRDAKVLFVSFSYPVRCDYAQVHVQKEVKVDGTSDTPNIALHAHAGFLNSALELIGQLSNRIEARLKQNPRTNILFTGHSAGGAVASLLHLSFRTKLAPTFTDATFSCITFGSPPVAKYLSQKDRMALDELTSSARVLNIVNEYDLVARADKGYIHSLIQLYSSVGPPERIHKSSQDEIDTDEDNRHYWPLPAPEVQHIGPIVVLKIDPPSSDMKGTDSSLPALILSAWRITKEDLSRLMFCRLSVHSRMAYRSRIQQIESGCLNGQTGWS
ncbi:alpha/beta-hydrolase [Lepidopterella palustris CBS 459.81]|uniref:Alpha/beta-hydrolase n=1 Tax=Lepidopterella palustris CBS 459.81 TaxID=1314670 RepID=A0A8E2E782_9PEZI|nr:alpha/beta-hydrolase [Lepidopterella palustris CBS 459.81]